jgi:predicted acyltransferase
MHETFGEHMQRQSPRVPQPERIVSVDALRGFDMFWLVGGTGLGLAIVRLCGQRTREVLLPQLDHRKWAGCTFYDVIFPLFVFVVGMSVVFSLDRIRQTQGLRAAYKRIVRRFVLMFTLGLIYYGAFREPWPNIRLLGVLQRLALCYLFTAILYCHCNPRTLVAVCAAILIGYWALFSFVPVPGTGKVGTAESANWARWVDERFLPGARHEGTWDANGLLSTLPATATCLVGVFAALLIKSTSISNSRKLACLILGGTVTTAVGWLWDLQFPVIKKLWTSSYVLVTGGYSLVLLGVFYLIVDVWRFQKWARPLIWIGANPLTIYMARNLADFNQLAERFVGGNIRRAVEPDVAYLLQMIVSLALSILLVWFLHRKGVFLRV